MTLTRATLQVPRNVRQDSQISKEHNQRGKEDESLSARKLADSNNEEEEAHIINLQTLEQLSMSSGNL